MTHSEVSRAVRGCLHMWGGNGEYINSGMCGEFSSMVLEFLGGETEELYESVTKEVCPGHCWVTFQGRHYDAEAPDGVATVAELPFMVRNRLLE